MPTSPTQTPKRIVRGRFNYDDIDESDNEQEVLKQSQQQPNEEVLVSESPTAPLPPLNPTLNNEFTLDDNSLILSSFRQNNDFGRSDLGQSNFEERLRNYLTSQEREQEVGAFESEFIYGTHINVDRNYNKFVKFVEEYKEDGQNKAKYYWSLVDAVFQQENALEIDAMDLFTYDKELYYNTIKYPQELLPIMDLALENIIVKSKLNKADFEIRIQVRIFNLKDMKPMRELNPADIDHLICLRGMVTRCSEIIPDVKEGFFQCSLCHATQTSVVNRGRIEEPARCKECGGDKSMVLVHNRCSFVDKQFVKLQETPEIIPEGETPHTVTLSVSEYLVDTVKPGDRIDVTGIYRAIPNRTNSNRRTLESIYKNYIDVIHFQKSGVRIASDDEMSMRNVAQDSEDEIDLDEMEEEEEGQPEQSQNSLAFKHSSFKITKKDEVHLMRLARDPNIYERLTRSLAPEIWEMDDVKKGILCQLFGGTHKQLKGSKVRGEINILLVGDPGVSKSQLLSQVHKIAPRGIYTSGKGSSAVGLTAYITRDTDTGDLVLESGALVLSDLGICCIDEFDKMSDATRSILHEVMEQQTVSVAKAGIICSLNARTSILAAANPVESRYNDSLSIVENIRLPPTLLSRFDLIYILRDIPDRTRDAKLANHLISLYYEDEIHDPDVIDMKTLTKYISYAKKKIHPVISEEAKSALIEGYVELRRLGSHRKQITATTRQLESLIRIAEALARMQFKNTVSVEHVNEAIRLVRNSIFKAAMDSKTGTVDIDILFTGLSKEKRDEMDREADNAEIM